jgi:hypothetical protein
MLRRKLFIDAKKSQYISSLTIPSTCVSDFSSSMKISLMRIRLLIDVVDGSVLEKGSSMRVPSALREGSERALEDGNIVAVSSPPSPTILYPGNPTVLEKGSALREG